MGFSRSLWGHGWGEGPYGSEGSYGVLGGVLWGLRVFMGTLGPCGVLRVHVGLWGCLWGSVAPCGVL